MSSAVRFRSPSGVTYPYPASRTWGIGLPVLLVGLGFGYKILVLMIGVTNSTLLVIFGTCMLLSFYMIWLGAASTIGAVRRSVGVSVTPEGISSATITGTSWAEWSSLGPFVEGTFKAGKQGVLPCVKAPVIGRGASKDVIRKQTFLIVDVFGLPAGQLAAELNSVRSSGELSASHSVVGTTGGLVQFSRKLSLRTVVVVGVAVAIFCFQFYRLLTR